MRRKRNLAQAPRVVHYLHMRNAVDSMAPEYMIKFLSLAEVAAIIIAREDGELDGASNVYADSDITSQTFGEIDSMIPTVRPNH